MRRILLIFLLLYADMSVASERDSLSVRHLEIEDGLSNNYIRCVYQDRKGFFWFGSRDGLNRYDGYGFKVFRNEIGNKTSLIHNIIHAINSDADNNIWIGTRKGLSIYDDKKGIFTEGSWHESVKGTDLLITNVIRDLVPGTNHTMLVATEGIGLLRFKRGKTVGEQIPLLINGKRTFSYGVQSVRLDDKGREWAFVQNLGLYYVDPKVGALVLANADIVLALSLGVSSGQVYIGTNNGLYHYDPVKRENTAVPGSGIKLPGKAISSITTDKHNMLYLGTYGEGVFCYDPASGRVQVLDNEINNSLSGEQIYAIFIDKNDRKWIGTYSGGVTILDPVKKIFHTWAHNPQGNSIPGNSISSFLATKDGKLYIGTDGTGLSIWDRKLNQFTNYKHTSDPNTISSNFISSMVSDNDGNIWIGTFTEGANRFDPNTKKFTRYKIVDPQTGVESKVAFTVFEDRDHDIWAGTLRRGSLLGGLYRFNPSLDKFELFDKKLGDLFTMMQTRDGHIWAGNLDQLIEVDKKGKNHRFYDLGYTVRVIFEDKKGLLWIGTEGGGLIVFNPFKRKIVSRLTTANGLCNNSVLSLIPDNQGNLWMSTYFGVSCYNLAKGTFRSFYQSDGLQSNQFQINAGIKLSTGEIAFGGIKGFSLFDPQEIMPHSQMPSLFLTGITVNNMPLEENLKLIVDEDNITIKEIEVPYDQAVFSFSFTALEFSSPEKISYKYFMDGWDRGWTNSGKDRKATYTHISEGNYTFRVRSTNAEGVWGHNEIILKIKVLPPWYRTWWAYLSYIAIISSLIYVYLRYRSAQTRLKYEVQIANLESQRKKAEYDTEVAQHNMERLAHEKERLINEQEKALADKRMSFFTNISHEFRSPLSLIINPINDLIKSGNMEGNGNAALSMIQRNAKRMLSLVDQLLLFRKAEEGFENITAAKLDLEKLSKEVFYCFVQQASAKLIDYRFENSAVNKEVYADRIKIEIVLFNLISNALKYTPNGGEIVVRLTEEDQSLLITVQDSGPGIPLTAGEKIFDRFYQAERTDGNHKSGFGIGLYLAKQFMEAHSGRISYKNRAEGGSIFNVCFLKGKAHLVGHVMEEEQESSEALFNEMYTSALPESAEQNNISLDVNLVSDRQSILVVDDERDIREYISGLFSNLYTVYQAENGEQGLQFAAEKLPDLIITDFKMQGIDGIEFCQMIKSNPTLSYIPVILLTASSSQEVKLKSVHGGADDYINKPFEREYLIARVANLLRNRNNLQNYFYNEITLQSNAVVVSEEYKKFLDTCILVVENHLTDSDFGIKALADEIGMSHSNLYKRVKSISGQSVNSFIRFIRLRKAAELMINSDHNVTEVAFRSGFNDAKYFGKQFSKLFGTTPSAFIRKHRKTFNKRYKMK
ncbi:two-component regulator propeller domain-containing protein [Pedobacter sp. SG918]|uniref:hybrid sensor histidine kinase/response regulator transcription factor n=1 Tax=Pedobacter sp. SG918 TaxID=2587136 RepID=UPI00146C88E4|nr:two-component regulator propeller domain-containing protein [Pedobacter sp. SG918]NMN35206.1 signal transduction histidine kinase/ligand-binding sensor domain-containing protein/CheY-like chemotaxis protein [Pedobacter sp. SG918]